ncbi:MAG: hypothetical protein ACI9HK_005891, partial [Pirellulaceae bacterium]
VASPTQSAREAELRFQMGSHSCLFKDHKHG